MTMDIEKLAKIMEREAMMPLRYPTEIVPRWKQVAIRVLDNYPTVDAIWRDVVPVACEAYLGRE